MLEPIVSENLAVSSPGDTAIDTQAAQLTSPRDETRRRASFASLVVAVAAGVIALGVGVGERLAKGTAERDAARAIAADAERLASTIDGALRSTRLRADGIASAPMLRAAIETDAPTMRDLIDHELSLPVGKGETIEIFQVHKASSTSLVRVPASAAPLAPLQGHETRLDVVGGELLLTASAPINGYKASGALAIATPVDVDVIRQAIAVHAAHAALTGLGRELALVDAPSDRPTGSEVSFAVPSADFGPASLTLVATPFASGGTSWLALVRYVCCGLAGSMLVVFVISTVVRRR
jgi:hypothetical protein